MLCLPRTVDEQIEKGDPCAHSTHRRYIRSPCCRHGRGGSQQPAVLGTQLRCCARCCPASSVLVPCLRTCQPLVTPQLLAMHQLRNSVGVRSRTTVAVCALFATLLGFVLLRPRLSLGKVSEDEGRPRDGIPEWLDFFETLRNETLQAWATKVQCVGEMDTALRFVASLDGVKDAGGKPYPDLVWRQHHRRQRPA